MDQVYSASCGRKKKRGVAALFNKSVDYNNENICPDDEGRYVLVKGTTGGIKITILNVYAPNEDCPHSSTINNAATLLQITVRGLCWWGRS